MCYSPFPLSIPPNETAIKEKNLIFFFITRKITIVIHGSRLSVLLHTSTARLWDGVHVWELTVRWQAAWADADAC